MMMSPAAREQLSKEMIDCAILVKQGRGGPLLRKVLGDFTDYVAEQAKIEDPSQPEEAPMESKDAGSVRRSRSGKVPRSPKKSGSKRSIQSKEPQSTTTTVTPPPSAMKVAGVVLGAGDPVVHEPASTEASRREISRENAQLAKEEVMEMRLNEQSEKSEKQAATKQPDRGIGIASWLTGHRQEQEWCEEHFTKGCSCKIKKRVDDSDQASVDTATREQRRAGRKLPTSSRTPEPSAETEKSRSTPNVRTNNASSSSQPVTMSSRPAFRPATTPSAALIATGWLEQQRRSRLRSTWKEVLVSLVEGRRPGEETTLWIQREVTQPGGGAAKELEPLNQIPVKLIRDVLFDSHSADNKFTVVVLNQQEEFIFRCPRDLEAAEQWVLTLRSTMDKVQGGSRKIKTEIDDWDQLNQSTTSNTRSFDDEKKLPDRQQQQQQQQQPGDGQNLLYTKSVRELRSIAHGMGIHTQGLERPELEALIIQRANQEHQRQLQQQGRVQQQPPQPPPQRQSTTPTPPPRPGGPAPAANAGGQPSDGQNGAKKRMTVREMRAIAEQHGLKTAGMERPELERLVAQLAVSAKSHSPPPAAPPATRPVADDVPADEAAAERRELEEAAARRQQQEEQEQKEKAAAAAAAEEERRRAAEAERLRTQQQQAAEQRRKQEEAAAEEKRKQEEAAKQAEQKRRQQEEASRLAQQQAAAEQRRKQEEAARLAEEERRKAASEQERRRLEAERLQREEEAHRLRVQQQQAAEQRRRQEEAARMAQQQWQQQQQQWQQAEAARYAQQQQMHAQHQVHGAQPPFHRPPSQPHPPQAAWGHPQQQHWQHMHQQQYHQQHPQYRQPTPPPQHGQYSGQYAPHQNQNGHAPPPHPPQQPQSTVNMKYAKMAQQSDDGQVAMTAIKHGILINWALQPPMLQTLRPIEVLITTVHKVFPPNFGVAAHVYFSKWTPVTLDEVTQGYASGNQVDDEKLKKAVRKLRFFLHPDKLPKDLTQEQSYMCKMLWDISNDAFEDYKKKEEDLGWARGG